MFSRDESHSGTDRHLSFRDLKYILGLFNVSTVGYNKQKYKKYLDDNIPIPKSTKYDHKRRI